MKSWARPVALVSFVLRFLNPTLIHCFCNTSFQRVLILRGCWPTKPTKLLNRPLNIQSEGKRGPVFKAMWDEPSVPRACLFQSSLLLYFPTQRICMKAPQTPGLERGYVSQHIRLRARGRIIYEINTPKWWNHKRDWAFSAGSRQGKQRNASAGLLWFSRPDESGFCVPELVAGLGYSDRATTA